MADAIEGEIVETKKEVTLSFGEAVSNAFIQWDQSTSGAIRRRFALGPDTVPLQWIAQCEVPAYPTIVLRQFGVLVIGPWTYVEIRTTPDGEKYKVMESTAYVRKSQFRWADRVLRADAPDKFELLHQHHPSNYRVKPGTLDWSRSWGAPARAPDLSQALFNAAGTLLGYRVVKRQRRSASRTRRQFRRFIRGLTR